MAPSGAEYVNYKVIWIWIYPNVQSKQEDNFQAQILNILDSTMCTNNI
jgi:hypothetical protein